MPKRLFGTDGVRGVPGTPPLDAVTLRRIGAAAARSRGRAPSEVKVLIGRDTRESGKWILEQLAQGIHAQGAEIVNGGVLPTPAVAFLARETTVDVGLIVSASHNPFQDNGVKVVTASGEKADDALERSITAQVGDEAWLVPGSPVPDLAPVSLGDRYAECVSRTLAGVVIPADFRMAIDCANGAAGTIAPAVFRALGCELVVTGDQPDGRNINLACGSTHPEHLARVVVEHKCRFGAAFDGDADRVVFVDHTGRLVDGDAVLMIAARRLASLGRLPHRALVATVMSNIALEQVLQQDGLTVHRCPVGDRAVWVEMKRRGLALGGEQSGHIIFSDHLPTGDGLFTAAMIVQAVLETGTELADLASDLVPVPHLMVNVRVKSRAPLETLPGLARAVRDAEEELAGIGRVVVRYSGTEPLMRIMVEGPDDTQIDRLARTIEDRVRLDIGVE